MAKKYLSIQEAADQLGISTDELTRMREKGDVRGFADRGTWKFKLEDIEKLGRIRQPDSDPDVQLMDDVGTHSVLDDEEDASEHATTMSTTIRRDQDGGSEFELPDLGSTSDSDVRLILDEELMLGDGGDSAPDAGLLANAQSDSDVRLVEEPNPIVDDGSDSDVKLVSNDSDSDVRLVSQADDLLTDSDSDVALVTSDAGLDSEDSILLSEGSDIALEEEDSITGGSSIKLAGESGISLSSPADSGISLEKDSGITLKQDSGITLEEDSGITLEPEGDDLNQTIPMLKTMGDEDEADDTQFEVPALDGGDESEFELQSLDDETETEANVLLFDDEDDGVDSQAATVVKKSVAEEDSLEIETLETGEVEFEDDEIVADDMLSGAEELDVFDTDDDDFDDSFETGESHAEFASPVGGTRRMAAPVETEWGTGVFVGLSISALAMSLCGMVMFDLVRTMWTGGEGSAVVGPITDMIAGLF